jgi:hypothetical protein
MAANVTVHMWKIDEILNAGVKLARNGYIPLFRLHLLLR